MNAGKMPWVYAQKIIADMQHSELSFGAVMNKITKAMCKIALSLNQKLTTFACFATDPGPAFAGGAYENT